MQDHRSQPAIGHLASHLRFWIAAAVVLALDLYSKSRAFRDLGPEEARAVLGGVFEFRRSLNAGAVFGSFAGYVEVFIIASVLALGFVFYLFAHSGRGQRVVHIALALILAGALGNLYDRAFIIADVARIQTASGRDALFVGVLQSEPDDPVVRIGDWPDGNNVRTLRKSEVTLQTQGVVRDFIKFVPRFPLWVPKLGGQEVWPWVFNIADAALVCGVGLLLLSCWPERKSRPHPKPRRQYRVPVETRRR
jgi:lipoprotein signal peptidase